MLEDGPQAAEPGLLLGKIQYGKTDTFEDITGLAFDRGIDIAIILTKYALVSYFVATAIRRIQIRENKERNYRTSALIHAELSRKYHEWQKQLTNRIINDTKQALADKKQTDQRIWRAIFKRKL